MEFLNRLFKCIVLLLYTQVCTYISQNDISRFINQTKSVSWQQFVLFKKDDTDSHFEFFDKFTKRINEPTFNCYGRILQLFYTFLNIASCTFPERGQYQFLVLLLFYNNPTLSSNFPLR